MIVPTVSLQIAPGSNASDQSPSWTEVGDRLLSFTYKRGRQFELDTIQAGTGSFELLNTDRVLDPTYTRGPFYGLLLPNMQIRLRATIGGTTYDLFRGHVQRWPTVYDGPTVARTTLDCVDRFASLAQATISGTFAEQLTGARIGAVLAAAGWTATTVPSGWTLGTSTLGVTTRLGAVVPALTGDAGKATVAAVTIATSAPVSALSHIQSVADSEPGLFFFNGAGQAVFKDRSHVTPTPDASVLTLTDDATVADATHVYYMDVVPSIDVDRVHNDIELTAADGTLASTVEPASVDLYWRRTLQRATQLRTADIVTQAGYLLYAFKDARTRVPSLTLPMTTTLAYQAILARELGDHLTFVRTPTGSSVTETMTQESQLESITVSGSPDWWQAVIELSPLPPAGSTWLLGVSKLGTETRLAYV